MKSLIVLAFVVVSSPIMAQDEQLVDPADVAAQVLNEGATSLDPSDILTWIDLPRSVKQGDSFALTITVENGRKTGDFSLESIDIDGSFLQGFRIESVTPSPVDTDNSFNSLTLEYLKEIAPGETSEFVIEMIAVEPGVYIGEASIWDEKDFLSRYVHCKVVE